MFTRSEVIVLTNKQTNKQTPLKTANAIRYATTLGNNMDGIRLSAVDELAKQHSRMNFHGLLAVSVFLLLNGFSF